MKTATPATVDIEAPEYKAGFQAGLRGDRMDNCGYKEQPRFEKWLTGWHDGRIEKERRRRSNG